MPKEKEKIYQELKRLLVEKDRILITAHENPDGDALGAVLACFYYLKQKGKLTQIYLTDEVSSVFNYLPFVSEIVSSPAQVSFKPEVIFMLDCANLKLAKLDEIFNQLISRPVIVNLDHHFSNNHYGDYNLVENRSSTCEIIYQWLKRARVKFDDKLANMLLTGIITDTNFFVNPNTDSGTLAAAAELVSLGAKPNLIWQKVYRQSSIKDLKLWGKALNRLQFDQQKKLAVTAFFQEDFDDWSKADDGLDGLSTFLNSLSEVAGVLVLREENNESVKGSLRTTRDDVDVSEIAKQYGGGGHKKAAGFKVKGKIVEDKEMGWSIEKIN